MKLLEKRKINEVIQAERKNVIDSGVFLAKKVDTLRQDLLNLEKQRADFIAGSQEALDKAIGELKREKSDLAFEVKEAKKLLAKLREPLDEEWKELEKQKMEVDEIENQAEQYFHQLITERKLLIQEKELVDVWHQESFNNKNETEKLLEKADGDREETKRLLGEVQSANSEKEAKLYKKEAQLDEKEVKLMQIEQILAKERLEFNKELKALQIKKQRIK